MPYDQGREGDTFSAKALLYAGTYNHDSKNPDDPHKETHDTGYGGE